MVQERPGGRTERNRKAVAEAVLSCIRDGRLDFEIQEITARSGVHRTTISRRWPDRGALMAEALTEHGGHLSIQLQGDWEQDVRSIVMGLFSFFKEPTELAMNRMLAISDNSAFHERMMDYWIPAFKMFEAPLEQGKVAGLVRQEVDPELIIMMISSVLMFFTALNRLPEPPDLAERLATQIIALCRNVPNEA